MLFLTWRWAIENVLIHLVEQRGVDPRRLQPERCVPRQLQLIQLVADRVLQASP